MLGPGWGVCMGRVWVGKRIGNPSILGQIERHKHVVPRGENSGLRPQIYCKPSIVAMGEVLLDSSYVNY